MHEGTVYTPGQSADVPEAIADKWIDAGWVAKAKAEAEKRAVKSAPPKRSST